MRTLKEEFNEFLEEYEKDSKEKLLVKYCIENSNSNFFIDENLIFYKNTDSLVTDFYKNTFNELKDKFISYKDKIKLNKKLTSNLTEKKVEKRIKI